MTFGDDFEWDDAKAASNVAKHGVSFVEAVSALSDQGSVAYADALDASRTVTVGMSQRYRVLVVVTTEVTDRTRIISARRATRGERALYEEG